MAPKKQQQEAIAEVEQAAQDAREYVLVEKRAVEVHSFADEMAANPGLVETNQSSAPHIRRGKVSLVAMDDEEWDLSEPEQKRKDFGRGYVLKSRKEYLKSRRAVEEGQEAGASSDSSHSAEINKKWPPFPPGLQPQQGTDSLPDLPSNATPSRRVTSFQRDQQQKEEELIHFRHTEYRSHKDVPFTTVKQLGHGSLGSVDAVRQNNDKLAALLARKVIRVPNIHRKRLLPLIQK